jgi:hypothetical protein
LFPEIGFDWNGWPLMHACNKWHNLYTPYDLRHLWHINLHWWWKGAPPWKICTPSQMRLDCLCAVFKVYAKPLHHYSICTIHTYKTFLCKCSQSSWERIGSAQNGILLNNSFVRLGKLALFLSPAFC